MCAYVLVFCSFIVVLARLFCGQESLYWAGNGVDEIQTRRCWCHLDCWSWQNFWVGALVQARMCSYEKSCWSERMHLRIFVPFSTDVQTPWPLLQCWEWARVPYGGQLAPVSAFEEQRSQSLLPVTSVLSVRNCCVCEEPLLLSPNQTLPCVPRQLLVSQIHSFFCSASEMPADEMWKALGQMGKGS